MDHPPIATPEQSREYRRRRDAVVVFALSWPVAAFVVGLLVLFLIPDGRLRSLLLIVAAGAWICTFFIWPLKRWCCPVCGQSFTKAHVRGRCEHCGIRFPR
jgi:hypothetical protein